MSGSPGQGYLPIFDTVVFIDWFGTLSTSLFWEGITSAPRHALASKLEARLKELFSAEKDTVALWMRGKVSDAEIVECLQIPLPRNYREDYLHRALYRDCRASPLREGMAGLVRALRDKALVAVATDNMACFLAAAPTAIARDTGVDAILSSSERRVLKAEDPRRFFAPMLQAAGVSFSHTILIDDCAQTCEVFREFGGRAYRFTSVPRLLEELRKDPLPGVRWAAEQAAGAAPSGGQLSLFTCS